MKNYVTRYGKLRSCFRPIHYSTFIRLFKGDLSSSLSFNQKKFESYEEVTKVRFSCSSYIIWFMSGSLDYEGSSRHVFHNISISY